VYGNLPDIEFPEFATLRERLAQNIELARETVSFRVGYEVEVSHLEPIRRDGGMNMRVYWRRKAPPSPCWKLDEVEVGPHLSTEADDE
jgi:hypothetical protein